MARHTNGPDLTDVETMMRAIEALHGGQVRLTFSPAGIGALGGMVVVLSYSHPSIVTGGQEEEAIVVNKWPCSIHMEIWSCVFEGLYRLDSAIGQMYVQTRLPEA